MYILVYLEILFLGDIFQGSRASIIIILELIQVSKNKSLTSSIVRLSEISVSRKLITDGFVMSLTNVSIFL